MALVHDWLTGMRGGEKVLELMCRRFPGAPLWTLLHLPGRVSPTIEARPIHASWLGRMPAAASRYRSYLPLFPLFAELHKAGDAELVVSTSHAVAKSMVRRRGRGGHRTPLHVCYIHTPMRYVWDMFDEYFGPERVGRLRSALLFRPIARLLQLYDRGTAGRVDIFVANSRYVADRVRRVYGREAVVLPPPVDTAQFLGLCRAPEPWYLVVSALVPYKRVDHAIRACHAQGVALKIVGSGPEKPALERLARELGAEVEFVGHVPEGGLGEFYRRARALLFPGVEDFGIVPVEAIASGCPVVALGVGGILDSMTGDTALFYHEATPEALRAALARMEDQAGRFDTAQLRARALLFSEERFLEGLERILSPALGAHRARARARAALA